MKRVDFVNIINIKFHDNQRKFVTCEQTAEVRMKSNMAAQSNSDAVSRHRRHCDSGQTHFYCLHVASWCDCNTGQVLVQLVSKTQPKPAGYSEVLCDYETRSDELSLLAIVAVF